MKKILLFFVVMLLFSVCKTACRPCRTIQVGVNDSEKVGVVQKHIVKYDKQESIVYYILLLHDLKTNSIEELNVSTYKYQIIQDGDTLLNY